MKAPKTATKPPWRAPPAEFAYLFDDRGSNLFTRAAALSVPPPSPSPHPRATCSHAHPSSQSPGTHSPSDATSLPESRTRSDSHPPLTAPSAHNTAPPRRSRSDKPRHAHSAPPASKRHSRQCRSPRARHTGQSHPPDTVPREYSSSDQPPSPATSRFPAASPDRSDSAPRHADPPVADSSSDAHAPHRAPYTYR